MCRYVIKAQEELASRVREHGAASSVPPEEEEHNEEILREVDVMFEAASISSRPPGEASASVLLAQQLKNMIVSSIATSPHSSYFNPLWLSCILNIFLYSVVSAFQFAQHPQHHSVIQTKHQSIKATAGNGKLIISPKSLAQNQLFWSLHVLLIPRWVKPMRR